MEKYNILLAGVGGQGIVLASDVISDMLLDRGFDVKKSEIHGMSQRGGVVSSFIRAAEKVHSPVPSRSEITHIASFEEMEMIRWVPWMNSETFAVANTLRIKPAPLKSMEDYPDAKQLLAGRKIKFIDASDEAKKCGDARLLSSVMAGAVCAGLGFTAGEYRAALKNRLKKLIDENCAAFERGKELVK
jgi:indolepyruvate ferredoxin oxidoreductase, beta subunit